MTRKKKSPKKPDPNNINVFTEPDEDEATKTVTQEVKVIPTGWERVTKRNDALEHVAESSHQQSSEQRHARGHVLPECCVTKG